MKGDMNMLFIYLSMIETQEDTDKFTEIYNKHKSTMHSIAFSILKNTQDAEDAVQEAFLKLARNILKIDEVSSKKTKSFLVILIKNTAIDLYRKKHHEQDRVEPNEENDMNGLKSTDATDILSGIISVEGYRRLVGLIEEMSDTYKDTLKLRFVHEWTNGEIADLLDISKNAVEFRICHGRAMLIKSLRREGYCVDKQQRRY
jgi:RNA polymerase sigma-70 factor (ECF subfamily)